MDTDAKIEAFGVALRAAARVANDPPARPGQNVTKAQVHWTYITRLREALDAAGIDWRKA